MFIDEHREVYGVEPICRVLPIAPTTYRVHAARLADPSLRSDRAKRDAELRPEIERAYSGASGHSFRRHPVTDSGVSGHLGSTPLSLGS